MTKWILSRYQKKNITGAHLREQVGLLASLVGIGSNLLLFALKLAVGLISGSISILGDAINNLSDCTSSLITLIGFKLAARPADEGHPYGHARFEYISGLAVSALILVIGFQFLLSSVSKIRFPEPITVTPVVVVVLLCSIGAKLLQGLFNRSMGRAIDSATLAATARDSINDVITTSAVLLAALAERFTGFALDGWMGGMVALFILWSGIGLIRDIINPILGQAPDPALVGELERRILSAPSVLGVHDMMVHSYGPGKTFASAHVEVPASQDIMVSHDVVDNIEREVSQALDILLVLHMDPIVADDPRTNTLRDFMARKVAEIDPRLTIHDFRMVEGPSHTNLIFDVVVPPRFSISPQALRERIGECTAGLEGTYYCVVTVDRSYTPGQ